MFSKDQEAPHTSRIVGGRNLAPVYIDKESCTALIDTGSQVTTISHDFIRDKLPHLRVRPVEELLTLTAAGGHTLPYDGMVEVDVNLNPGSSDFVYPIVALVMPGSVYNSDVPVIIGTNVIKRYAEDASPDKPTSTAWNLALNVFKKMNGNPDGLMGHVKSTRAEVIPAGQTC